MDIKTSCLGVLATKDATGYEIRKMFEDGPFSVFAEGGFGSIYPALKSLEQEGMVTKYQATNESGPAKKIYQITDTGRNYLLSKLSVCPDPDKYKSNLLFSLYFADSLSSEFISNILEERLEYLENKIDILTEKTSREEEFAAGQHFVHEFGLHMNKAAHEFFTIRKDQLLKKINMPETKYFPRKTESNIAE